MKVLPFTACGSSDPPGKRLRGSSPSRPSAEVCGGHGEDCEFTSYSLGRLATRSEERPPAQDAQATSGTPATVPFHLLLRKKRDSSQLDQLPRLLSCQLPVHLPSSNPTRQIWLACRVCPKPRVPPMRQRRCSSVRRSSVLSITLPPFLQSCVRHRESPAPILNQRFLLFSGFSFSSSNSNTLRPRMDEGTPLASILLGF